MNLTNMHLQHNDLVFDDLDGAETLYFREVALCDSGVPVNFAPCKVENINGATHFRCQHTVRTDNGHTVFEITDNDPTNPAYRVVDLNKIPALRVKIRKKWFSSYYRIRFKPAKGYETVQIDGSHITYNGVPFYKNIIGNSFRVKTNGAAVTAGDLSWDKYLIEAVQELRVR